MSYSTDTQLYLPFDGSLVEASHGTTVTTSSEVAYSDAVHNEGVDLSGFSGTVDALSSLSAAFTIGFWLKSANPGMVTNPTNGATESLRMPLLNKAVITTSLLGVSTASFNKFIVWEETHSDGRNKLKVVVNKFSSATLTSSSYSIDEFHHFWIVYDGTGPSLKLYVDMVLDVGATISGTIPSTLAVSTALLGINRGLTGSTYNTAKNQGVLDDLVVFSTARDNLNDIYRAITLGALYVAGSTESSAQDIDQAVVFDDTSTIQVTAMYGNRGNVYAGRSDGKILKGTRTLWESRRDFSTSGETEFVSIITRSGTDNLIAQDGSLNITNAIVRV